MLLEERKIAPARVCVCAFCFFLFSLEMSRVRASLFGGPEAFSGAQLPTYQQVRRQFAQEKIELLSKSGNSHVSENEVAKNVINHYESCSSSISHSFLWKGPRVTQGRAPKALFLIPEFFS